MTSTSTPRCPPLPGQQPDHDALTSEADLPVVGSRWSTYRCPLEDERVCRLAEEDGEVLLPWQTGHWLDGASLREGNAWQHHVYVGVYSLDRAFAELRAVLSDAGGEEEWELPRAGDSALAAFTVAGDGRVILRSQTLSSCAWRSAGRLIVGWGRGIGWRGSSATPACLLMSSRSSWHWPRMTRRGTSLCAPQQRLSQGRAG